MIGMAFPLPRIMLELGGKGGLSWPLAWFFALNAALALSRIIFVGARA